MAHRVNVSDTNDEPAANIDPERMRYLGAAILRAMDVHLPWLDATFKRADASVNDRKESEVLVTRQM